MTKQRSSGILRYVANGVQKRKVVIENEEGTANSEELIKAIDFIDDAWKVLSKNDPPVLFVAFIVFVVLSKMGENIIQLLNGIVQSVCFVIVNFFKYLHNIIIFKIYMKYKNKCINDNVHEKGIDEKIDKKIEKNVIDFFQWKEERQEQKDSPAFRSDSALKKPSKRHKNKKNGD